MSITKKPTHAELIPESAIPLYIVTSGDNPKIEEYRLSHETPGAFRVYRTFGDNLTEHRGLRTIMIHNLNQWGHQAFYHHIDALRHQRQLLIENAAKCKIEYERAMGRLDAHTDQWGKV